jgi:predicted DNA-binding transcriptional regulator AlpA
MENTILQLEKTNAIDFENKIVARVETLINGLAKKMQTNEPDALLTRDETAKMLSISLVTLHNYTKNDIIPAFKIGYKVRYKKSDILQALQKMNKFSS